MSEAPPKTDAPQAGDPKPPPPMAKLAIEAGPLVVFFVANAKFGIFKATAAFMVAITISLLASWKLERRLPPVALVTTFFVLVFGGLTIYLENETFIKLKPTIVNGLFALILSVGLAMNRLFLKVVFGTAFRMRDEGWRAMTVRWIFFFITLALLNEFVWRTYSTDTWVTFKVFGIMPLTIVFSITLVPLINRYQIPDEVAEAPAETTTDDS